MSEKSYRRRMIVVVIGLAITLVVDTVALVWGVPIADEMTTNPYMSLGYILTFFVVLANLIIALVMISYIFHEDSYASDRWT